MEMAEALPAEAATTAATLPLATASLFGFATAVTMVAPLLVDIARDLDVPLGQAGLLAAAISLPWALGAPLTGLLSDRIGRRPLIVLALAGLGGASLAAAFASSFGQLLAARAAAGVFGAFGPASIMAAVGDLYPARRRGMAMGWLNLGFGLAAVAGVPAVGLVGGLFGWRSAFVAAGLVLLGLALVFRLAFPSVAPGGAGGGLRATYRAVGGVPRLANVLGANLLERAVFNGAVLYLPAFLMLSYGLTAAGVAPALVVIAVGALAGNVLGGWLGDRLPRAPIFIAAQLAAGAIGLVLFGTAAGLALSVAIALSFSLTNASSRPAFLALGSELSTRHRGAVLGLLSLTNQGGAVIGSALGGAVVGLAGYPGLAVMLALAGVVAAALALPLARGQRS
jgi:MFS transporter, DHA1 family, inner membrane transport protein